MENISQTALAEDNKTHWITLVCVLVTGFLLRIYHVGTESIWYDEGASIVISEMNLKEIFFYRENNPPLYYIVLHFWMKIFGNSEIAVRLPSVLFGFFSLLMVYKIGSEVFDRETGLLGTVLLVLSAYHVRFSQEARTYSLTLMLTLLSMYFFLGLLERGRRRDMFWYLLFSVLLIYSHVYGLFVIMAQNCSIILRWFFKPQQRSIGIRQWIFLQVLLGIFFLPWVGIFVSQVSGVVRGGSGLQRPSVITIIGSLMAHTGSGLLFLFLGFSCLAIFGLEKMSGRLELRNCLGSLETLRWQVRILSADKVMFFFIWLAVPIIVPFVISRVTVPIFSDRYIIVATVALYLLAAHGIKNIGNSRAKALVIGVIVLISSFHLLSFYRTANKEPWREAAHFVDDHALSTDLLLFNDPVCLRMLFNYYSRRPDLTKTGVPEKAWEMKEEHVNELRPLVKKYERVWLISSHSTDRQALITKTLSESFTLASTRKYPDIVIYLFERKSDDLLRIGHNTPAIDENANCFCFTFRRLALGSRIGPSMPTRSSMEGARLTMSLLPITG